MIAIIGMQRDIIERKNPEQQLQGYPEELKALSDAQAAIFNMMEDLNEANEKLGNRVEERTKLLQESEKEYRSLIEKANDAIIRINEKGVVSVWNKEAESIFGYSCDEMMGKDVELIVPEKYKEKHRAGLKTWTKSRDDNFFGKTVELEGLKKDGSLFSLEISLSYEMTFRGQYYFLAIIRDITKRKKMEKHLMQSERLQSVGSLAAGVAHEVNNPLSIMEMDLTLIKESIQKEDPILENIDSLRYQLRRIAGIVQGLQDISRPVSSPKEKVDINKIFNSHMLRIVFKELKKNRITVDLDLEKNPPIVEASRTQLIQVFLNMIKNAEDAIQEKELLIKNKKIQLQDYNKIVKISTALINQNSQVLIEFFDTGVGIKKEHLNNIFDPFFTTKGFNGTGLGLPICFNIIKSFNGDIKVESSHLKGSLLKISLPVIR